LIGSGMAYPRLLLPHTDNPKICSIGNFPQANSPVLSAGVQRFAIRREGKTPNRLGVASLNLDATSRLDIPEANLSVLAARCQPPSVRGCGNASNPVRVPKQSSDVLTRHGSPKTNGLVLAGACEGRTVV